MKLKPPWDLPGWREVRPIYLLAFACMVLNALGLILTTIVLLLRRP